MGNKEIGWVRCASIAVAFNGVRGYKEVDKLLLIDLFIGLQL